MSLLTRRNFLLGTAALAGGAAVFGYAAFSNNENAIAARAVDLTRASNAHLLAGWVRLAEDGRVTVFIPHSDMGQGIGTALAMQLAEEMDADWSMVGIEPAPVDTAFANWFLVRQAALEGRNLPGAIEGMLDPLFRHIARTMSLQITAGSTAVRFTGEAGFRPIGAAVRSMLLDAAAERLGAPREVLAIANHVITDTSSGRRIGFGELAADVAARQPPGDPPLKALAERTLTSTSPQRFDIPDKVFGTQRYGIDTALPDLLYASVRHAPVQGGQLMAVDEAPALAVSGVEAVVRTDNAVMVVANGWRQAETGAQRLQPQFSDGGFGGVSTASLTRDIEANLDNAEQTQVQVLGDAAAAFEDLPAERIVEAVYHAPYLHHAPIEPINITARFAEGRLEVWAGEQDPLGIRADLATISGLPVEVVTVHPCAMGGSFGRRGRGPTPEASTRLVQAWALAEAMAPRPVKLIWNRVEDTKQGAYRPMSGTRIRVGIDEAGMPLVWSQVYTLGVPVLEAAHPILYEVPHQGFWSVPRPGHLATRAFRGVNSTQHALWRELMIDELAERAGADPLHYRRALVRGNARAVALLDELALRSGWDEAPTPGRGRGMALSAAFGTTLCAVAIEASLAAAEVTVHRVTAVVDCGTLIHPDNAAAQIEGAIVQAISTALRERITVADGVVEQQFLSDYGVMPLARAPEIAVHFLPSDVHAGGLGEAGFPPVSPALLGALSQVTGTRFRNLPIEPLLEEGAAA